MRLFVLPNKESVDQQNFLSVMQMNSKFTQILGEEIQVGVMATI